MVENALFGPGSPPQDSSPARRSPSALAGRTRSRLGAASRRIDQRRSPLHRQRRARALVASIPVPIRFAEGFQRRAAAAGGGVSKPTVAIVGRPNVGKSTLFNRILGGRDAIVSEHAGTTRDRHFGDAEWNGRHFWLVDTGGLVPDSSEVMDKAIRRQVELALAEADLILFSWTARRECTPVDQAIAEKLRRANRPVLLAVNKLDIRRSTAIHDFHQLGFGEPQAVSATVGTRSGDLLDAHRGAAAPAKSRRGRGDHRYRHRRAGPTRASLRWPTGCWARTATWWRHVAGTTRDAVDSLLRYQRKFAALHRHRRTPPPRQSRRRHRVLLDAPHRSGPSSGPRSASWWSTPRWDCTTRTSASPPRRGTGAAASSSR